jgi:DNA-binding response OmpR family regulator
MTDAGEARGPATILVADDDPHMRLVLAESLRLATYHVLVAADGAEALALALAHHPAAVLLDRQLPDVDGLELCRRLKSDPAALAPVVVILSARARDSERAEGMSAGADAYVTKPFSPRALIALLADHLR